MGRWKAGWESREKTHRILPFGIWCLVQSARSGAHLIYPSPVVAQLQAFPEIDCLTLLLLSSRTASVNKNTPTNKDTTSRLEGSRDVELNFSLHHRDVKWKKSVVCFRLRRQLRRRADPKPHHDHITGRRYCARAVDMQRRVRSTPMPCARGDKPNACAPHTGRCELKPVNGGQVDVS